MNNSPFFSIIVPVYNTAPYLREALNCIRAQTFTSFEVIMVDDGSTDGSETICDEYASIDCRFKVLHQANAGVSAARNKALDNATGKFIGFVDSDDTLLPGMLSHFYDIILSGNADIVQSIGPVNWEISDISHDSLVYLDKNQAMDEFFKIGKVRPSLWLGVYRTTLFSSVRFPENIYQWEDYAVIAVLVSRSNLVAITCERFYTYEYRIGSSTKRPMTERHLSCLLVDDYLSNNKVYRKEQDRYDVIGFFIRCCVLNYTLGIPGAKKGLATIIKKNIIHNLHAIFNARSVSGKSKLIMLPFVLSARLTTKICRVIAKNSRSLTYEK